MTKRAQQIGPFVLDNDLTFPWWVRVWAPDGKGGKAQAKFLVTFVHLSPEDRQKLLEEHNERLNAHREAEEHGGEDDTVAAAREIKTFQHQLLRRVVTRVSKLKDGQGNDLDFGPDDSLMEVFLDNSWARDATFQAYIQALTSRKPEGN